MFFWVTILLVAVVVGVCLVQYRARRGTYQTLASRQPQGRPKDARPLGTEAIDLDEVSRTARRNESLERGHTSWTRASWGGFGAEGAETDLAQMPDDETYAQRFHAAFQKKKSKDT